MAKKTTQKATTTKKSATKAKPELKLGKKKLRLTDEDVQGVKAGASSTTCCHCDVCAEQAVME